MVHCNAPRRLEYALWQTGQGYVEDPGSVLYSRLKGLGSGGSARFSISTYKKCWCCGSVFYVLCGRPPGQHAGHAPFPKEESRVGGGALLPTSTSWVVVVVSARRATTTSRPSVSGSLVKYQRGHSCWNFTVSYAFLSLRTFVKGFYFNNKQLIYFRMLKCIIKSENRNKHVLTYSSTIRAS